MKTYDIFELYHVIDETNKKKLASNTIDIVNDDAKYHNLSIKDIRNILDLALKGRIEKYKDIQCVYSPAFKAYIPVSYYNLYKDDVSYILEYETLLRDGRTIKIYDEWVFIENK